MLIDTLKFSTAVDMRGWQAGMAAADKLIGDIERRVANVRPPAIELKSAGGGVDAGGAAADLAAAFVPASAQIRNALQGGLGSLEPVFRRLAAQVEALTGASLAHFRRLDSEVRFPLFQSSIAKLRSFVQGQFDSLEGRTLKLAKGLDQALGGLSFAAKLKNQLDSLRSFSGNSARELARLKLPPVVAAPAVAGVNAVKGSADRAAASFKGLGLQIAGAFGLVGVGYKAVGFLKEAIKNASDLGEQVNNTNTRLGESAPAVHRYADAMARDFGKSRTSVLGLTTDFAGLASGLGNLKGDKLEAYSIKLAQLASDFESSSNTPLKEVGEAFRTVLSGEQSDLLKRYSVITTEAALKQYALSRGLVKVGQDLGEEQKFLARGGILMEKLAFANGDLARTINDPANAYRRFSGQVENLGVTLGTALLPVVNEVLGALNSLAGGTQDALGRSQSSFADWSTNSAFAVNTVSLYLSNWGDTVQLATLSAEQSLANFAGRIEAQFSKIGTNIANAFRSPLEAIQEELRQTWINIKNIFSNIKELTTKGFDAKLVDINAGYVAKKIGPAPPAPKLVDFSAELAAITNRIEGRRAAKPTAPNVPAPPRPNVAVDAIAQKAAEKAFDELESFAKSFKQKVRSPLEEYSQALDKAKKALDAGLITQEDYSRREKFAKKEAGFEAPKRAAAVELSSAEGYSTLLQAMSGRSNDFTARLQEQTLKANNQQVSILDQINKKIGAGNQPGPIPVMRV